MKKLKRIKAHGVIHWLQKSEDGWGYIRTQQAGDSPLWYESNPLGFHVVLDGELVEKLEGEFAELLAA